MTINLQTKSCRKSLITTINHIDFISRDFIAVKRDAFVFKEAAFLGDEFAVAMAGETAEASVGGDDTVARHFRRERITPQRLPDSLRRLAADAPRQLAVGHHAAARDEARGVIYFLLENSYFHDSKILTIVSSLCVSNHEFFRRGFSAVETHCNASPQSYDLGLTIPRITNRRDGACPVSTTGHSRFPPRFPHAPSPCAAASLAALGDSAAETAPAPQLTRWTD